MEQKIYDIIIIGSGPAGLCAAIYAKRAQLEMLVIEKDFSSGGQMVKTYEVDNYPGLPGMSGYDMAEAFRKHADKLGAAFVRENVKEVQTEGDLKKITTNKNQYLTRTLVIAAGTRHRTLGIPGEEAFSGMGVSYCATCDGAFFKGGVTAVIGGGDVAVEDAIFLSRICTKVYLIHRRDELRAAGILQESVKAIENVEIVWDTIPREIRGAEQVQSLAVENVKTGETKELAVDGVFVAVGILPNTEEFGSLVKLNESGYIEAGEDCASSISGIFAAGDIRTKQLRQIVTAAADGANAVDSAQKYLMEHA